MDKELIEKLAEFAHAQWSMWMDYMFGKCTLRSDGYHHFNPDGTILIPKESVDRWERQASTAYSDLPEEEKERDKQEGKKLAAFLVDEGYVIVKKANLVYLPKDKIKDG